MSPLRLVRGTPGRHIAQAATTPADQVRRLDWRFLLPDPRLGRVAFLGPEQNTLLGALRAHAADTVTASHARVATSTGDLTERFDTCVLQFVEEADIQNAARLLAPGGWLYWEITRPNRLAAAWRALRRAGNDEARLGSLDAPRGVLERAGFHTIAAFWHYPDFESSRWIVPLDESAGVEYFLRNGPPVLRRIRERIGSRVVHLTLLPEVSSSVSFVAQKPIVRTEMGS